MSSPSPRKRSYSTTISDTGSTGNGTASTGPSGPATPHSDPTSASAAGAAVASNTSSDGWKRQRTAAAATAATGTAAASTPSGEHERWLAHCRHLVSRLSSALFASPAAATSAAGSTASPSAPARQTRTIPGSATTQVQPRSPAPDSSSLAAAATSAVSSTSPLLYAQPPLRLDTLQLVATQLGVAVAAIDDDRRTASASSGDASPRVPAHMLLNTSYPASSSKPVYSRSEYAEHADILPLSSTERKIILTPGTKIDRERAERLRRMAMQTQLVADQSTANRNGSATATAAAAAASSSSSSTAAQMRDSNSGASTYDDTNHTTAFVNVARPLPQSPHPNTSTAGGGSDSGPPSGATSPVGTLLPPAITALPSRVVTPDYSSPNLNQIRRRIPIGVPAAASSAAPAAAPLEAPALTVSRGLSARAAAAMTALAAAAIIPSTTSPYAMSDAAAVTTAAASNESPPASNAFPTAAAGSGSGGPRLGLGLGLGLRSANGAGSGAAAAAASGGVFPKNKLLARIGGGGMSAGRAGGFGSNNISPSSRAGAPAPPASAPASTLAGAFSLDSSAITGATNSPSLGSRSLRKPAAATAAAPSIPAASPPPAAAAAADSYGLSISTDDDAASVAMNTAMTVGVSSGRSGGYTIDTDSPKMNSRRLGHSPPAVPNLTLPVSVGVSASLPSTTIPRAGAGASSRARVVTSATAAAAVPAPDP